MYIRDVKVRVYYLGSKIARLELKGIGGNLDIRWIMLVNSMIHEETYQF